MDFLFYLFLIFTNDSLRILMYNVDTNRHIYVCHRPVSFIDDFTLYGNGSFLFSHVLHLLQNWPYDLSPVWTYKERVVPSSGQEGIQMRERE